MSVKKAKRWSQRVTERGNALDLVSGVSQSVPGFRVHGSGGGWCSRRERQ
jgi:hypothetical protein